MTALTTSRHRVSAATAQMRSAAASVVDASVWSMDAAETAATLTELTHLAAQVAELTARVAAHADDLHVGAEVGVSSAANWLAHTTRTTRPAAAGTVKLGHALEAHPQTREALAQGEVLLDQARVIVDAVDQLGGLPATMLVLIDEDSLMRRVEKAGILDTGEKISPALARRLACQAQIIPIVLGGDSLPLDIGRARRFHTKAQRYAMLARDRGCRAEGCDRTRTLQFHHQTRWTDGGPTNIKDGITLCHWHHQRAHDTSYETSYLPNGTVTFHRRQ